MKRPLSCACFLFGAVVSWLAASTNVGAADCITATPPLQIGSYGSTCFDAAGFLVAGQLPGGDACEYRGYFVITVPPSDLPYVSAELRVSIHSATAPTKGESVELRPVVTPIDLLINLSGDRAQTFSDLADGELLGSREIVAQAPSFDGLGADLQVAIPLTEAGVSWINASRGRSVALGISVPKRAGTSEVPAGVRFMDGLSRHQLVLNRADAQAPQVYSLDLGTRVHAGGTKSLSVVACGRPPLITQWYKDGVALPGETHGILSFNPALPAQAGTYEFRASNDLGTASTPAIDLEVVPLTFLSELSGFTAPDGAFGYCLSLVTSSSSLANYTWLRNGEVYKSGSVPFLCFEPILLKDAGSYQVIVSNTYGSVTSGVAQVSVNPVPPVLEGYPQGTQFAAGFPGELYSLAKGSEPLRYQWLKDSMPIAGATGDRLRFPAAMPSDSAAYQVVAANAYGAVTSQLAQVEVVPALLNGPVHVSGSEGGRALLWAQPTAIPETAFQWYREGVKIAGAEEPFLLFPSLKSGDAGAYFVVASNAYGSATSVVARVMLETFPLNVNISASDPLPMVLGDDLVLGALISGSPQPRFQWFRNSIPLQGATNATLVFPSLSSSDAGLYTVEAENSMGSALSPGLQVDVVAQAPQFVVVPVDPTEVVGSVVTLQSRAVGGPQLTYQWRRRGVDLPGATNATLVLQPAEAEDAGTYEIVAGNTRGEARYSFTLSLRAATRLDQWDWSLPRPQGGRLLDITWGDGRFVAVGRSGNVVTSVDGVDWERSIIEADCDLSAVAYGQGRFVTVGITRAVTGDPLAVGGTSVTSLSTGVLLTSPDGRVWTSVPSPSPFPVDIAYGNGVFVLTGSPTGVTPAFNYTSVDGIHWTPQYNGWTRSDRVNFVNGEFWASDQGYLYRSVDGAQWRPALRSLLGEPTGFVAYGNSQYVALGGYGQFGQISADGDQWLPFISTYQGIQSLTFGNGRFVAAVYHDDENPSSNFYPPAGTVITTEDGREWTERDTGTRQELESVIFADGRFWAVGEAGTICSSSNGIDWSPSLTANLVDYYGLTQHGDTVVVAGDDGAILTSVDGQTWTRQVTSSGRNLHAVHSAGGLVVAGGRGGRIMTSPDAIRWTNRDSNTTNYVQRIGWADRWVAVCEGGDILTSADGGAWSAVRTDPPSDHEGVAYGAGYWLVAGGYFRNGGVGRAVSTFFYSTDGVHWERLQLDIGVRLRDVAFGDGRFVAVGNDGQVVVLVPTGDPLRPFNHAGTFTVRHSVPLGSQVVNLRRVRFSDNGFLVVGNDGVMVSFTGVTEDWIHHRSRTSQNLHDVLAAGDGSFYTVGNNGMILRSGVPEPHFTSIHRTSQGVRLVFESAPSAGPLRLEESEDMTHWSVVADPATSPVDLPSVSLGARYFRLVTR